MKFFLVPFFIFLCCFTVINADTIKINFDDWCPYICVDKDKPSLPSTQKAGYEIDIINEIFNDQVYQIQYLVMPWARAIIEATEGRLDALISPGEKEAPDLVFPKESIGYLKWCFYTLKKSTWNYTGVDSLKDVTLGFLEGNVVSEEVQEYIEKNKNDSSLVQTNYQTNWIETNFNKLVLERITAILDEPYTLDYYIKEHKLNDEFRKAGCLEGEEMFMAFSPNNRKAKEYANTFDEGIMKLRESGKLKTILDRYGLTDWKLQN